MSKSKVQLTLSNFDMLKYGLEHLIANTCESMKTNVGILIYLGA